MQQTFHFFFVLSLLRLGSSLATPSDEERKGFMTRMKMSGTAWQGRLDLSCSCTWDPPACVKGALFLFACSCGRTLVVFIDFLNMAVMDHADFT